MPGNAAYVDTLTFSVPATMPAGSPADRDAQVIKAATEELADYGCIPASDFQGSGDSFSVQVRASDHARQWLEDQRPPAEKLELLLAGLEGLVDDLTTTHPGRDRPCIDTIPHPHPGRPVTAPDGGARTSIVGWSDREAFLQAVAADVPDGVRLERYQGGWSKRLDGAEDLKHPRLRGLERVRAEAAQRDGELSGFTATFRSGDVVHHYQVSADWAQELDECLDDWEMRVRGAREEQTRFPHLKQWASISTKPWSTTISSWRPKHPKTRTAGAGISPAACSAPTARFTRMTSSAPLPTHGRSGPTSSSSGSGPSGRPPSRPGQRNWPGVVGEPVNGARNGPFSHLAQTPTVVGPLAPQFAGRQTGPNTVAFRGGKVTVAVPSEKYARDLRTTYAPAASDSCPYGNFCGYTGSAYTGDEYDFYYCGYYDTSSYLLSGGSWSNNQTQHRRVYMYGSRGTVIYTTPNAFYHTASGDWGPVYDLKTCITGA
ncbi:hypothetical protein ACFXGR_44035 [Streptomyces mirabilis]|uniref:hypothetical protein n=1 Tax=Streptomyces mirabilis TaxID=68239 RepID=UPI0036CEDF7A